MLWTEDDAVTHLDKLVKCMEQIKVGEVTILTGSNGTGKSMLRKALPDTIATQFGIKNPQKRAGCVMSMSMQLRTESKADFGALSGIMGDLPWLPTSASTWSLMKMLFRNADKKYIVIDEPEIGCSEETQLGLVVKINEFIKSQMNKEVFAGMLIITHSRLIVRNLAADTFINLDGMSQIEWLERKIEIASLDELESNASVLYNVVQKRVNSGK